MKNIHLEHPEDSVLTGDVSCLDWFVSPGTLTVKIDGAPSIVWGTNPNNGRFFIGTKAVFNKKKIRIAHSHEEINALYSGEVASLLHVCFNHLPRISGIVQGDFIGLGGLNTYTPNTITYKFPEIVTQVIIVAPHTFYHALDGQTLQDAIASPLMFDFETDSHVRWVQPDAYILYHQESFSDVQEICAFARQMSSMVTFVDDKKAAELRKQINNCIRSGVSVEPEYFDCDPNLIRFWKLVKSIKDDCLFLCRCSGPDAYIGSQRITAEGFVMTNEFGSYKLVNREVFSYHNFNHGRFQCASS